MEVPGNAVETAASFFWIEDGIIHTQLKDTPRTAEGVAAGFAVIGDLTEGKRRPVLVDVGKRFKGGPGAWQTFISDAPSLFTAIAFVVDAELQVEVGPFPDIIHRLLVPFIVCTDRDKALAFLQSFQSSE